MQDPYTKRVKIIRKVLSEVAGIPEDELVFDESGKHADLAWRVPGRLLRDI